MLKKTCLLIVILLSIKGYTQQYAALNHIGLIVSNADKSAAFYSKWFHLTAIKNPFPGQHIIWLSLGGSMQLHIIEKPKYRVIVSKDNHIAFSVASIPDFIKLLKADHFSFHDLNGKPEAITPRPDGVKQIFIHDPDGYMVEVNDAR